jgi:phage terminase large subunit
MIRQPKQVCGRRGGVDRHVQSNFHSPPDHHNLDVKIDNMEQNEKRINLLPYQTRFFDDWETFVAMVAGWASGKTMCGILKGLRLSMDYGGNLGLICRKEFTDLRDSTMKDFEDITGLSINRDRKEVVLGNGSVIMFRHAEELSKLQNINLGWYLIEQGEELDTQDQFMMLFGRMRRILTPSVEVQELLRNTISPVTNLPALDGIYSDWKMLMEDAFNDKCERVLNPDVPVKRYYTKLDIAEKALVEQLHIPLRQGMTIANQEGHNWIWNLWKKQKKKDYSLHEATSFENTKIPASFLEKIEKLKKDDPKKYNRYVLNSWEDYDLEGAFYASLMSDALKEGRLEIQNLYQKDLPVYTAWDLGVSDTTAIVLFQLVKDKIHLIDCCENDGKGMDFYCKWLMDKPYIYVEDWLPHDAKQRMQGLEVSTRLEILRALRNNPVNIVNSHSVQDGIETVRGLLNKCYFDVKCQPLVDAMNHYKRQKRESVSTDKKIVYQDKPLHDWSSNFCDSMRYMCMAYRYQIVVNNKHIGYPYPEPDTEDSYTMDYEPLGVA